MRRNKKKKKSSSGDEERKGRDWGGWKGEGGELGREGTQEGRGSSLPLSLFLSHIHSHTLTLLQPPTHPLFLTPSSLTHSSLSFHITTHSPSPPYPLHSPSPPRLTHPPSPPHTYSPSPPNSLTLTTTPNTLSLIKVVNVVLLVWWLFWLILMHPNYTVFCIRCSAGRRVRCWPPTTPSGAWRADSLIFV